MANTKPMVKEFFTLTEIETQTVGEAFACHLSIGDVLCLEGPIGAGKTQFVKGLARGLGFPGEVTSPTFALIHEYEGDYLFLVHCDFFRLECEVAAEQLGINDYFSQAVLAIEWGSRFPALLPSSTRTILFRILENGGRHISCLHTI